MDGINVTYGSPRKHIWTLAAGVYEAETSPSNCPCNSPGGEQPPSLWVVTTTVSQVPTILHKALIYYSLMIHFGMERGVMQMRLHAATLQTSLGSLRSFLNQPLMTWRCASALVKEDLTNEDVPFEVIELYMQ